MRNLKFKEFREQLKATSRSVFLGSNKVMQVALGRSESDEIRPGIYNVSLSFYMGMLGLFSPICPKKMLKDKTMQGKKGVVKVLASVGPTLKCTGNQKLWILLEVVEVAQRGREGTVGRKKGATNYRRKGMASQVREWTGIQQFPAATQTKLLELLGKLKQEDVSSLTILVMGKGGVGKSSTVNSLIGERIVTTSAFQSENQRPVMVSRTRAGFTLNVIDTPGLIEGGYVNDQALEIIKRFLLNKTIDVLLYVDRLDAYRVDTLDKQVVKAITESFGKKIWNRGIVVLTHALLSPPDCLSYEEFCSRRSEALLKIIQSNMGSGFGSRVKKQENATPVVLVENSGRCNKNDNDEKVLPNGTVWIPELVKTITDVVSNGSETILFFVVVKRIQGAIKNDIARESKPLWELRDMGDKAVFASESEDVKLSSSNCVRGDDGSSSNAGESDGNQKAEEMDDSKMTRVCDKLIGVFMVDKPTPTDWRRLIAFSTEWSNLRPHFFKRCMERAESENDLTMKHNLLRFARKLREVDEDVQRHQELLELIKNSPLEVNEIVAKRRKDFTKDFFVHLHTVAESYYKKSEEQKSLAKLGTTCLAAVQVHDNASESHEALRAAELKLQDIINSPSVDAACKKIDSLAERNQLDSTLVLMITKAWSAAKETDMAKDEAKDVLYHLYKTALGNLQRLMPKEIRIVKYLLTVDDPLEQVSALNDAFTPGIEVEGQDVDSLYTTPEKLHTWITTIVNAYHNSQEGTLLREARDLMNPEVIKKMEQMKMLIEKKFM
ncbi:unnamed protein product [Rhodiola kirilowii]